jgi:DNA topoisomerase-1
MKGNLPPAAVAGLNRSEPRGPGISREVTREGLRYRDPFDQEVTDTQTLRRIGALAIPPAWKDIWISPDPFGHIQATGVDSRGRTQYLYHELWREQRDAQKFAHMLRFAAALPVLRTATVRDLSGRHLDRDRVAAGAVRLIDLGLFRIGGEKYAELDHHYGATTLQKRDVRITRDGIVFDYIAKEGKRRLITVGDEAIRPTVRALVRSGNNLDSLFCFRDGDIWRPLHSHEVSNYIAANAGGHFTAKEFRTWNATVLMALFLANAEPSLTAPARRSSIIASIRGVATWLGDTPTGSFAGTSPTAICTRSPPCPPRCRPRQKRRSRSLRYSPTKTDPPGGSTNEAPEAFQSNSPGWKFRSHRFGGLPRHPCRNIFDRCPALDRGENPRLRHPPLTGATG